VRRGQPHGGRERRRRRVARLTVEQSLDRRAVLRDPFGERRVLRLLRAREIRRLLPSDRLRAPCVGGPLLMHDERGE
jgi:hypothetical protein